MIIAARRHVMFRFQLMPGCCFRMISSGAAKIFTLLMEMTREQMFSIATENGE